jgi:hypothetical protein
MLSVAYNVHGLTGHSILASFVDFVVSFETGSNSGSALRARRMLLTRVLATMSERRVLQLMPTKPL